MIQIGIIFAGKPFQLADRKAVFLLYLSLGVKNRQIFNSKNPHIFLGTLYTPAFWTLVDESFFRRRNETIDRHVFLITKQLKDKTVEHFYGKLNALTGNCDSKKDDMLDKNDFKRNLIDSEIETNGAKRKSSTQENSFSN